MMSIIIIIIIIIISESIFEKKQTFYSACGNINCSRSQSKHTWQNSSMCLHCFFANAPNNIPPAKRATVQKYTLFTVITLSKINAKNEKES